MQLSDILNNPHFCNLVAIIRIPLYAPDWSEAHPDFPVWVRIKTIEAKMSLRFTNQKNKYKFTELFINLLKDLSLAEPRLRITQDDIRWFAEVMDQEYALVTMSMLFASLHVEDHYMTPQEIAAATGTAESNWRNKAAAGELPGAIKKGKLWLIPYSILRSQGILREYPPAEKSYIDEVATESE